MDLPLLLCGPILRQVTPESVYIWVALSKSCSVDADLYHIKSLKGETAHHYEQIRHLTTTKTIQLGDQLFIQLIKLTPVNSLFPTNSLLGYNLIFNQQSRSIDLKSLGLLTPNSPHTIVYGNLKYPTFTIHEGNSSNILYGSCRKFHGKGFDSLTSGDLLLEEVYQKLDKRPTSLFLMGDQIYADDIADPLFPILSTLGIMLAGALQKNLKEIDIQLGKEPYQSSINKIHGRKAIMKHYCGFTSNHADNHLIHFEEYAAMYLVSWSPELWHLIQEHHLLTPFNETVKQKKYVYSQKELNEHQLESDYVENWKIYKTQSLLYPRSVA